MNRLRKISRGQSRQNFTPSTSSSPASNAVAVRPPLQVSPPGPGPALSQTYKTALVQLQSRPVAYNATPPPPLPRTSTEQYWAARALSAETLLTAQIGHRRELRSLSRAEEAKRAVRNFPSHPTQALEADVVRQRDLATQDARHAKLDRLVLVLLAMLAFLVLALSSLTHRAGATAAHTHARKTAGFAHFTIPILSPFTSVVEHETSVVGSKMLAFFALVCAGLAYFTFRHWFARRARP
ncbi:hypothetical protein GGX14DRAFT_604793 [Mycena pura]|uniref:Uncharacterized protein n=1 Tax=Mycena pura TaxID=153505 RepID=A0AAD6VPN9_9AGAR|nr:hypothetical protein GGX14DRAFT_604793 [Mycena pura]